MLQRLTGGPYNPRANVAKERDDGWTLRGTAEKSFISGRSQPTANMRVERGGAEQLNTHTQW